MTMTEDVPSVELAVRAQPMLPTPEAARKAMETYQSISQALIDRDNDIQVIKTKKGPREFPKRSAFQKLANAYRVSTEIVKYDITYDDGQIMRANVVVRATHPDGRYSEGDGACSRKEERFARGGDKIEHDLPATAKTRATNRAVSDLIAFGAVSAEEMEAEAGAPAGASGLPAWASPVADVGGVAATLTVLLAELGVTDPDRAAMKLGQTIFDDCGDSIPVCVARVIEHIAAADRADTPAGAVPVDAEATEEAEATEPTTDTKEKPS